MRALPLLALLAGSLWAQDDELPPDAQAAPEDVVAQEDAEAKLLLSQALRRLTNSADWVVECAIRHETKPPPGMGGGAGAVMIVRQSGPGGQPFEGQVEAWQAEDGAVVVTSTAAFPGFALYTKGGRTLKEVTFEEEVPGLEQIRAELAPLVDRTRLARYLLAADLASSRDAATGALTFRGKVDRDVVKPMREDLGMMVKRVVGAEAELTLSPEGALRQLQVRVLHSDPVHRMLRGKAVRIQIQGGALPVPGGGGEDENEDQHDAPTGSTTYTFALGARAPSERAQAFRARAERLLDGE